MSYLGTYICNIKNTLMHLMLHTYSILLNEENNIYAYAHVLYLKLDSGFNFNRHFDRQTVSNEV